MSRFLDKAFNQAQERHRTSRTKRRKAKSCSTTHDNTVEKDTAINIIAAFEQKDYLKILGLPFPDVNELGEPVWPVSKEQISKSYRQMSLLVHPDKNPSEKARQAFQLLNQTHKILLDDAQRRGILKTACEVAKERKERREATATVDERIKINAEKIQQKRKLTQSQYEDFSSEILRQMKERQRQKRLRQERLTTSQYTSHSEKTKSSIGRGEKDQNVHNEETALGTSATPLTADGCTSKVVDDEWTAAVIMKSKRGKRKPCFLF